MSAYEWAAPNADLRHSGGRAAAIPQGDLLPLDRDNFWRMMNSALRTREKCVVCGEDGEYWYAHGWLCRRCGS